MPEYFFLSRSFGKNLINKAFALAAKEKLVIGSHLANTFSADEFNHDVMEAYEADSVEFTMGDQMNR